MDQWGKGKAFQCGAADCGTESQRLSPRQDRLLQLRAGMSSDAELDRVSDFDLFGGTLATLRRRASRSKSAWMKGRSRPFAIRGPRRGAATILSVGLQRQLRCARCDRGAGARPAGPAEPVVLEFLNSKTVVEWAEITLGL